MPYLALDHKVVGSNPTSAYYIVIILQEHEHAHLVSPMPPIEQNGYWHVNMLEAKVDLLLFK